MAGLGAKDILRNVTALEQLIEEINFQRAKEMRQCLMSKDSDTGFVVVHGTTYWTDLFVRHFLFQTDRSTDADDLLFFIRKKHVRGSRYVPKYQTEVEVYRKDSRKLPIGDPDIDWEETVYLNLIIHQFDYTLTLAVCTRTSPKDLQVLRRHSQKVYASPSRRRMDTKGEVEEITYPNVCFHVDNFDEVFSDMQVRDGEMVCVELVAADHSGSRQAVIFLGSIRYDALKRVYDARASLSSKVAQRMMLGLFSGSSNQRIEFVRMKGPQGKGHAEMAVTKPKGSGVETPTSEPGVSLTDLWDADWEDEPEDRLLYRHQRRLSDPSANFNSFINSGWRARGMSGQEGGRSRSENEGLDSFADGLYEIESGDVRDAGSLCSGRCCMACGALQQQQQSGQPSSDQHGKAIDEEALERNRCSKCRHFHTTAPVTLDGVERASALDGAVGGQEARPAVVAGMSSLSNPEGGEPSSAGIQPPHQAVETSGITNANEDVDVDLLEGGSSSEKQGTLAQENSVHLQNKESKTDASLTDDGNQEDVDEEDPQEDDALLSSVVVSQEESPFVLVPKDIGSVESEDEPEEFEPLLSNSALKRSLPAGTVNISEVQVIQPKRSNLLNELIDHRSNLVPPIESLRINEGESGCRKELLLRRTRSLVTDLTGAVDAAVDPNRLSSRSDPLSDRGFTLPRAQCSGIKTPGTAVRISTAEKIETNSTAAGRRRRSMPSSSSAAAAAAARHAGRISRGNTVLYKSFPTDDGDVDSASEARADNDSDASESATEAITMSPLLKRRKQRRKVSIPYKVAADGTKINYFSDIKLDDGAYNPLWSTRGFTQTFHFWKENRRAQSVPFNAYLTYVTLPWFNIITDILDHETGPILTF